MATDLTTEQRLDRLELALYETAERTFAALGRSGPPRPALVSLVGDVQARLDAEAEARKAVEAEEQAAMQRRVAERIP